MQNNEKVAVVISNNIVRLMRSDYNHGTLEKLSKASATATEAGVSTSAISRVIRLETVPSVEILQKLARPFGLEAWQLLVPDLDPKNPQSIVGLPSRKDSGTTDAAWLFSDEAMQFVSKKPSSIE